MAERESPYVKDPANPTDAEITAAIERGLANGTLITAEDFLARSGSDPGDCPACAPFACDDPDAHLGIPPEYAIPGCHCGAASDGRDCMCFE